MNKNLITARINEKRADQKASVPIGDTLLIPSASIGFFQVRAFPVYLLIIPLA